MTITCGFEAQRFINPTVKSLPPSGIRRFFDLVASTRGVISLGVGEPDFVTPWHIREACVQSLERGYTMYTSNYGLPELRQAIAGYLAERFGLSYDPQKQVMVTIGASEAVDLALRTVINPGDEVLIPEPCYVSYQPIAQMAGGVPVTVPTTMEDEFAITAARLEKYITPRTKVLILCFPNNPTGAVLNDAEMQAIAALVKKYNLLVISDEIYAELRYDGPPRSFAALPGMQERTILVSGFSKAFAMTGWRVGYVAAHPDFLAAMVKIHQYTILCAPVMGQMAALEALRHGRQDVERMVAEYDRRRRLVVSRLREMGLECFEPRGAFYVFPSIKVTGLTSTQFAEELLKEEKVAVVPGPAFGSSGEGFIRCSYATSLAELMEAMNRMERFVARRLAFKHRAAAHA
ncbi:MAG: aminotransferase [Moorella sp. (in: firmicutes)]|jgi:aminotransferase|uniref:aminotransferase class I/II-fold pyridoxal phosphate-dependent enzyme n=1 Tax=Moorella sp. E306M TaxID=2572683 RepID=UPI0010FFC1AA|nr:aminotransferase class I/II-fold pyridoxal phosphate-dependent enzyme [Moorella sp. E306M]MDK2817075.1 aminotransferase [Moorella sp. (in: firmicutes)]MDK2894818.1 aminotransferase [Moorella sp. (in: firmicutes)]GEA19542.1 aminotransferase [Moorella sp. E306M]